METAVKNKRPFGFYVCSTTFAFERAAYYACKFLLYMFITTAVVTGGLGLTVAQGASMQSSLVAFTYLAPIFGGIISDRWIGAKYTIPLGMFIMGIGYIIGSQATSASLLYVMITLVSIGTGLFKGNISALNGTLFDDKTQLDSAFSLQYSFVNIGSFVGTTVVGILYLKTFAHGEVLGFLPCFMVAGITCIVGGIWFVFGWRFLGEHGKKPFKAGLEAEKVEKEEVKPLTTVEKKRIAAIVLVSAFSVVFWIFWYLTYLAFYDYGTKYVNMSIGGFQVPIAWFDSLNAFVCIALGPVLGILWFKLAQRPKGDLSLFKKTAIGFIFLAAAFLMLVISEITRGVGAPDTTKAGMFWGFLMFGVLLSFGEMFFSPLGNSFVTKYAPKRMLSVLMGVWIVATFIAGKAYGPIYAYTTHFDFVKVYIIIPIILFVAAIILFIFDGRLKKLLEDEA